MPANNNPADFFREMLGHWERMANGLGNEAMKSHEFASGIQSASGATMAMQAAFRDQMEKTLAAANMPTRSDIDALALRLDAIEAVLTRIDARLSADAASAQARHQWPLSPDAPPAPPPVTGPARTRRAPKKPKKD